MNKWSKQQFTMQVTVKLFDKDGNEIGLSIQEIKGPLMMVSRGCVALGTLTGEVAGVLVSEEYGRHDWDEELPE